MEAPSYIPKVPKTLQIAPKRRPAGSKWGPRDPQEPLNSCYKGVKLHSEHDEGHLVKSMVLKYCLVGCLMLQCNMKSSFGS